MTYPADFWFDRLKDYPVLDKFEALELFQEVRKGQKEDGSFTPRGIRALKKVVSHNMRFVVNVWQKQYMHLVRPGSHLLPDLLQEGCYGLHKAAINYKPELGYAFSTYSNFWIRRYINVWLCNRQRVVRAPITAIHVNNKYAEMSIKISHDECIEKLSEHFKLPAKLVQDYLILVNNTLTAPSELENGGCRLERTIHDNPKPESNQQAEQQFDLIASRAQLDPYERELLLAFQQGFGLDDLPSLFPDDRFAAKRYNAVRRRFRKAALELFPPMSNLAVA